MLAEPRGAHVFNPSCDRVERSDHITPGRSLPTVPVLARLARLDDRRFYLFDQITTIGNLPSSDIVGMSIMATARKVLSCATVLIATINFAFSMSTVIEEHSELRDWTDVVAALIADLGGLVFTWVIAVGDVALFVLRTLMWLVSRMPVRETLLPNFYQIGVLSLPVVALTGTFIGMVLAVQSYDQFRSLHIETRLGGMINLSLVRELGPVLAATMLAGRVGSAMAAELGTMRVTEQIDALTAMGSNPLHYLVVPRFLACLILIPTLTVMADFMGVVGGAFYSIQLLRIDEYHYWENSSDFVNWFDLVGGMIKSLFFGGAIAMISCHRGFNCTAGAEGVGRAATSAFVVSFVSILVLDLFLGIIINQAYGWLFPNGPSFL